MRAPETMAGSTKITERSHNKNELNRSYVDSNGPNRGQRNNSNNRLCMSHSISNIDRLNGSLHSTKP